MESDSSAQIAGSKTHISSWCCEPHAYRTITRDEDGKDPSSRLDKDTLKKWGIRAGIALVCIWIVCWWIDRLIDISATSAAESLMSYAFGVESSVNRFDTNLMLARYDLQSIVVENPEGYDGHAIELDRVLIDFDALSFMFQPIHLQLMTMNQFHIIIKQLPGKTSNFDTIMEHAAAVFEDNSSIIEKFRKFDTFRKNPMKIFADKVAFNNISITSETNGLISHHHVRQVLITDVGKKQHGVRIYSFLEILVRSLFKAIAVATSHEMQRGLVHSVEHFLDYGSMQMDTGAGLASHSLESIGSGTQVVGKAVGKAVAGVASAVGHKKWGEKAKTWMQGVTSNMTKGLKEFRKDTKTFFKDSADRMADTSEKIKEGNKGENAPVESFFHGKKKDE